MENAVSREERIAFRSLVWEGPNTRNLLVLLRAEWLPASFRRLIAIKYNTLVTREQVAEAIALLGTTSKEQAWLELGAPQWTSDER